MLIGRAVRVCLATSAMAVALTATSAQAAPDECMGADTPAGGATPAELAAATQCLVNRERTAAGLTPLAADSGLARTAENYAGRMILTQRFAHEDTDGGHVSDRVLDTTGTLAPWLELGENLGWGTFDAATPRAIVAGWMNSPTHRENILYARWTTIGVGIAEGAPSSNQAGALTYVTVFGSAAKTAAASSKRASSRRCTVRRRTASRAARVRAARACRARSQRRS